MNLQSENNTWLENLIQNNGQAMEEIKDTPYPPVVYTIPKEWLENGMKLLENAVQFQPTLYKMIEQLATWGELEDMRQQQQKELLEMRKEMLSSRRE